MAFNWEQKAKACSPIWVIPSWSVTEARCPQLLNVELPIFVTASGIQIEVSPELKNADSPIALTERGMSIEVRLVQFQNARSPIVVKDWGRVMEVNPVQLLKAELPITVTVAGSDTDVLDGRH